MGKSRRGKEVIKVQRSYSAYSSTNYLISPTEDAAAEDEDTLSSAQKNGESDEEHDVDQGSVAVEDPPLLNKHDLYQRAVQGSGLALGRAIVMRELQSTEMVYLKFSTILYYDEGRCDSDKQKPKGDISYLQKFFLNYVGGRTPLHLREDFCGTALICAEWVRGDTRRTAVGLDLDEEALTWGLQHNVVNAGSDVYNRIHLFCGDVLNPLTKAQRKQVDPKVVSRLTNGEATWRDGPEKRDEEVESLQEEGGAEMTKSSGLAQVIPGADMICAFNYSCCCLQKRSDLVRYFSEALKAISTEGGVFAMDLYGGASSECALKLRRRFDDFQYTWEQEDFDVITRTTRISLHFRLKKNQGVLRHAFSYHWRLWTIPEVRECLEEAGFHTIHFWIREMADLQQRGHEGNDDVNIKTKYEEVDSFSQEDAWNAYVVAVAPPTSTEKQDC